MKEVAKARLYSLQGPIDFINGPPHHPLITRLARRRRHGDGAGTLLIHERMAGGVNTPTTPGTPQHRPHRSGRWCRSRCGSHPTARAPSQRMPLGANEWSRCRGW